MTDLMVLPDSAIKNAALAARTKQRGHAWKPGTGPAGETCRSCKFVYAVMGGLRRFHKCGHRTAPKLTGGSASDIHLRDPACAKWERAA